MWLFSILDFNLKRQKKILKRVSRSSNKDNKFCILDEIKYSSKNFDILYFIILKYSVFGILQGN